MKIDNFIESELKVTASDNVDISSDLTASQTKNISELLEDEKKQKNNKNNEKETSEENS